MARKLPVMALLGAATLAGLWWAERKYPLREQTWPEGLRTVRNVAMGASSLLVVQAIEVPLTERIARGNLVNSRGIAQKMPRPMRLLAGVAAMDYGFYLWHVATHKVPFLWRYHRVHHIDPDMDMSTAMRFHAVDMLVSLPWRLVQVWLSGVDPKSLTIWRNFFNASVLFHHSNLKLPHGWDDRLSMVITTPAMHGVHHSKAPEERDSNWTSGLSFWDRLHRTFRKVDNRAIAIGVNDIAAEADLSLERSFTAPYRSMPEEVPVVNSR
ncbi:sterol desaturase family protein [Parerythrobacter jejuensis]|uniref:Fatty acid hydroxylase n=1 Tax=Parerythrobacter jejuensis TaxID=795812 RepID=A0A845AXG0_9SPHN|nr:sterol desaturase family protein [Parerythrobacter jejuensis]MXP31448.1 fatty acid hydroxylase [Parerythrobacter jejuensis]